MDVTLELTIIICRLIPFSMLQLASVPQVILKGNFHILIFFLIIPSLPCRSSLLFYMDVTLDVTISCLPIPFSMLVSLRSTSDFKGKLPYPSLFFNATSSNLFFSSFLSGGKTRANNYLPPNSVFHVTVGFRSTGVFKGKLSYSLLFLIPPPLPRFPILPYINVTLEVTIFCLPIPFSVLQLASVLQVILKGNLHIAAFFFFQFYQLSALKR